MQLKGNKLGESVGRSLAAARWSAAVVAVLVALWLPIALRGGPEQAADWYLLLGLTREGVLGGGFWQPLSYGFLHGSGVHLLINVIVLLLIGGRVEHILGGAATLRIYLLGVLAGGVAHLLLVPSGPELSILVGASGGAVAWLLTLTTLSPDSRMWPLPVSAHNLGLGLLLGSVILVLSHPGLGIPGLSWLGQAAENRGLGSLSSVGHACHLGGGVAGWLTGRWILRPRVSLESLRRQRQSRERRLTG